MIETEADRVSQSPFHRGEKLVHQRLGVGEIEDWARKVVRDHMPEQHWRFHTSLPFLVLAARDQMQRPWATILEGPEGFVAAPDDRSLTIQSLPGNEDALAGALSPDCDLGILGIQLETRRRNRINGRASQVGAEGFSVSVDQTFGNCTQYIRQRAWRRDLQSSPGKAKRGHRLTSRQSAWISAADTFFIASGFRGEGENAAFGMDASHRGGEPGFVQVLDAETLRFPDYAGNNHFNTIGNLMLDPRVGLLFVNFTTGSLLQLTGEASIEWEGPLLARFPGARRLVTVTIKDIVERPSAVKLRWQEDAAAVRSLRLVDKQVESVNVTSFVFESRDQGQLTGFEAGQHLPIELDIPGLNTPLRRTYSLSNGPNKDRYRISVKREPEGLASGFLHDCLELGAVINSRPAAGSFKVTCADCPLVLVSAGVGITPMMSILHSLAQDEDRRPVWFVHGARDGRHHPFAKEVRDLAAGRRNTELHIAFSQPDEQDRQGQDYDSQGRINGALLKTLSPAADAHYFICGPVPFMAQIETDLEQLGIAPHRIHTESFGPVA